jgi:flavorubredoxin
MDTPMAIETLDPAPAPAGLPPLPVVTPYRVADDTYVIPQIEFVPPFGFLYLNSMVILGKEPVLVDTGTPIYRERWLAHVFSLVDPKDVRWIYLSHDDRDHTGNLLQVLEACPNATLVTDWFSVGRLSDSYLLPLPRCRFLNEEESLEIGDRALTAVRPPFFDSPTTRGLYDARTGVYWSADCFSAIIPHAAEDAADIAAAAYREGFLAVNRLNHPWHNWLDEAKWGRQVDRLQSLAINTIATGHGPAIHGKMVAETFAMIREIPTLERWPLPTQRDLEAMLAAMAGHAP